MNKRERVSIIIRIPVVSGFAIFLIGLCLCFISVQSKAANKALSIPAEFTTTNENKAYDNSFARVNVGMGAKLYTLSKKMTIDFSVYIPKTLFSGKKNIVIVQPNLILRNESGGWDAMSEARYSDITVSKKSKNYTVTAFDRTKKKTKKIKGISVKKTGKYIRLTVKNNPVPDSYYLDSGEYVSRSGKKRILTAEMTIIGVAKKNVTLYVDNVAIKSKGKSLVSANFSKINGLYQVDINNKKSWIAYPKTLNIGKISAFNKLYDDIRPASSKQYVSRTDKSATTNTIKDEYKAKAAAEPDVTYKKLPKWHGTHLSNMGEYGWNGIGEKPFFTEDIVKEAANEGFNFARCMLDTRIIYSQTFDKPGGEFFDGDSSKVNLNVLKNLDDLVSWGIKYGVHICIGVGSTPGGYMIGGDEEASRELIFTDGSKEQTYYYDFWELMAKRYADIPSNALSFNLMNEPPTFATDEQYSSIMKHAIRTIHDIDADRLLFVDMLDYGKKPIYGLVGEEIVQASHIYDPTEYSHSNDEILMLVKYGGDWKAPEYNREFAVSEIQRRLEEVVFFSKETDTTIMITEFGCCSMNTVETAVSYFDDMMTAIDSYGLPWCMFAYDSEDFCYVSVHPFFRFKGGTYVKVSENRYVAKEIREVFAKHMN